MKIFNWIRRGIKDAVLGGFDDALNELDSVNDEGGRPVLLKIVREALPAPVQSEEDEPSKRRKRS